MIVDNAATGATLKANSLEVFDTLINSTTRLYASKEAWASALNSTSTCACPLHRQRPHVALAATSRTSCFSSPTFCYASCRPSQARPHRAAGPAAALRPGCAQAFDADLQLPSRQAGKHARFLASVSTHTRHRRIAGPPTPLSAMCSARHFRPSQLTTPFHDQCCRLKAPTVSRLHGDVGYAIQIAAEASKVPHLVPKIREQGGSDIVVTSIRMLVA